MTNPNPDRCTSSDVDAYDESGYYPTSNEPCTTHVGVCYACSWQQTFSSLEDAETAARDHWRSQDPLRHLDIEKIRRHREATS